MKRYEVMNVQTCECFGNHTHAEAVSRAQIMRRNWNYTRTFAVMEIGNDERLTDEGHSAARG